MSRIQSIAIKEGYKVEVLLDNESSVTLSLKNRLGTVRFGRLADPEVFRKATTDGSFICWDNIEISLSELFYLAQK